MLIRSHIARPRVPAAAAIALAAFVHGCTASDQCHAAGTCNPANGVCSNPPQLDGTACDDGDACTGADRCTSGVCAGPPSSCGDGVVQAGCGEVCDHGAGNGSDQCCGAASFPGPAPAARCAFNAAQSRLTCR